MQKTAIYGIIAAAVVAAGIGIGFAIWSTSNVAEPAVASPQQSSDNDNEVRVITHAMGETEITGTPERVVILGPPFLEYLTLLGVEPVGAASVETTERRYASTGLSLPEGVVNVGESWEPNFEVLAQLEPDIIIGWHHASADKYEELNAIAPTLLFDLFPLEGGPTQLEAIEQTQMAIADALNRHDRGVQVIQDIHAKFAEGQNKIEAAGLGGTRFLVGDVFTGEGDASIFNLTIENGMTSLVLEEIGLENAIQDAPFSQDGSTRPGLEGLSKYDGQDVHFFYTVSLDNDNVFERLEDNPVWNDLEFVKKGNLHDIGNFYIYGGPALAMQLVDKAVEALTADGETRTISHAMGETKITGTPQRVVLLSLGYPIESMLAFDIEPAGIVLREVVRNQWGPDVTHWTEMADVGTIVEPNFESIAQLEPDLIIGTERFHSEMYDDLSELAPTVLITYPAFANADSTPIGVMEKNFMTIADALNRHDEGAAIIENMYAELDEAKNRIEAAGAGDRKVIMGLAWSDEGTPYIRLSGGGKDLQGDTIRMLGLADAVPNYEDSGFQTTGRFEVDLEGLAALDGPDVHLLYTVLSPSGDDEAVEILEDNPVWNDLSFVKEGRVHNLGYIDSSGPGPLKLPEFADRIADALTGE
jgi:ABC-type Fe3+-hydroxamate transport system substrate-binding protein